MSEREPAFPFPAVDNPLRVTATVDGKTVAATKSLMIASTSSVEVSMEDLKFSLEFDGTDGPAIDFRIDEDKLRIVFPRDDAPTGAAMNPQHIASVNGQAVFLSVFHQTIGTVGRLVVYTLLTEGKRDE